MRKIILILLILLMIPACADAKAVSNNTITNIENSIFGYDYRNETDLQRVDRIESYLYGAKKTGDIETRLKDVQADIGYVEPQKVKPSVPKKEPNDVMALKEDSSVEYPMVDAMENEVFKTTYKDENIYKRLDRLEEKIFNKKTNDSLNDRVERLSMAVTPRHNTQKLDSYTVNELNDYYTNSGLEKINDQSMPFQLAVLEEDLLKNSFEKDNNSNRLSRLEQKLFKRTFTDDNDISRLQRIMVAYDAKKNSYKYENNRKMQNMATASQIGGILLMILAMIL